MAYLEAETIEYHEFIKPTLQDQCRRFAHENKELREKFDKLKNKARNQKREIKRLNKALVSKHYEMLMWEMD